MTVAADRWVKPDPLASPQSLERRFRTRRFVRLAPLIEAALARRRHVEILDPGGTEARWQIGADLLARHAGRITITLVNNEAATEPRGRPSGASTAMPAIRGFSKIAGSTSSIPIR